MKSQAGSPPRHLEDGDLIGYMDGALDLAGHRRAEGHLAHCEACRRRMDALQARAAAASGWLASLDTAPSDPRRALAMAAVERARFRRPERAGWDRRGLLAAAASIALLLTVAFGTPPGRAWVGTAAERLGIGAGPAALEEAAAPAGPDAAVAVAESAVADPAAAASPATASAPGAGRGGIPPGMSEPVHFSPAGNYVKVRFDSRQSAGAAAIWVRDEAQATGQVVGGRRSETLVPTADGLRIRNRASSRADYTIVVPTRFRFLRLQIGDEPETLITISRASRDWLWTVSLAE
jgi:hypothetical protein